MLSDGVDVGRDEFLYSLGATDVCHYFNFDQTTLTHIIHNVYLHAQASFQYQQEINRMPSYVLNMTHELKTPSAVFWDFPSGYKRVDLQCRFQRRKKREAGN